jgi:hypothetical protein
MFSFQACYSGHVHAGTEPRDALVDVARVLDGNFNGILRASHRAASAKLAEFPRDEATAYQAGLIEQAGVQAGSAAVTAIRDFYFNALERHYHVLELRVDVGHYLVEAAAGAAEADAHKSLVPLQAQCEGVKP